MKLSIINSGSHGNCYIFESSQKDILIAECGVNFNEIKKVLDFDFSKLHGVLLTHSHIDHSRCFKDIVSNGINLYSAKETFEVLGILDNPYTKQLKIFEYQKIGPFTVLSFDVKHDAVAPLGFVIHHEEMGNTLFLTDTYYVEYKFDDLNNILIEANYDINLVSEGFLKNRIIQSHMSIDQCINTLKDNDLRNVNHIVLLHLSDRNSNAKDFKKRAEQATGKNVVIAEKGLTINDFNIRF